MLDLIMSLLISQAPLEFGLRYSNQSWTYQHEACVVGRDRLVRLYNWDHSPAPGLRWVSEEEFARAEALFAQVTQAPYRYREVAADVGSLVWYGRMEENEVKIKERGDYLGQRVCGASKELAKLIESWCGRRRLPEDPS